MAKCTCPDATRLATWAGGEHDYLSSSAVLDGLQARAPRTSVILTGRDAKSEIADYADLVSEMREVKHPFASGIKAQRGLDF